MNKEELREKLWKEICNLIVYIFILSAVVGGFYLNYTNKTLEAIMLLQLAILLQCQMNGKEKK